MNPASPVVAQNKIARSISREDMAKLPIRRYAGRVCVVATPQDLGEARSDLLAEAVVGLDTETRPAFRKGESHLPALVQGASARPDPSPEAPSRPGLRRRICAAAWAVIQS